MAAAVEAGFDKVVRAPVEIDKKNVQELAVADARLLDDQAAAAAVAESAEADAAVQAAESLVAEAAILPTDAPMTSIGEIAQAPASAPAATETSPAATTPPPVAEESTQVSPWIIGGAGLVGVGIIAAIADDDDDGPSPVPIAEEPPPVEVPPPAEAPPPVNTAPTSPEQQPIVLDYDRSTALSAENFPFEDADEGDALTSVRITDIQATDPPNPAWRFDPQSNHGYELIGHGLTWDQARLAADARGGYLAILDSVEEMQLINGWYTLSTDTSGATGTWIGASQAADQTAPDQGWTWIDDTPLDPGSPLWNNQPPWAEPNDALSGGENNAENFAAIFDGVDDTDTHLIYDAGLVGGQTPTETQSNYLVEYDPAVAAPLTLNGVPVIEGQVIAADQLGNLSWNSLLNNGGTLTFQVADASGAYSADNTLTFEAPPPLGVLPPTMIALEDQHLNVLA